MPPRLSKSVMGFRSYSRLSRPVQLIVTVPMWCLRGCWGYVSLAVLCDDAITKSRDTASLDVPDSFWQVIEAIVPVLQPLPQATEVLGEGEVPTRSSVYIMVHGLVTSVLAPLNWIQRWSVGWTSLVRNEPMAHMCVNNNDPPAAEVQLRSPQLTASFLNSQYKGLLPSIIRETRFQTLKSHVMELARRLSACCQLHPIWRWNQMLPQPWQPRHTQSRYLIL